MPIDELSNVKGKLVDWVKNAAPRLLIRKLFKRFLITYKDIKGVAIYGIAINRIGEGNSESLQVSFVHLEQHTAILSYYVSFCPIEVLQIFDEVAMEAVVDQFEDYERIQSGIHVRITDLPVVEALRDLRY